MYSVFYDLVSRWKEALIGISLGTLLFLGVEGVYRLSKTLTTPSYFMVVNEVVIPDHEFGDDPLINYSFVVRRPFYGNFSVEVVRKEDDGNAVIVCRGSGSKFYTPEQINTPDHQRTLSWYINRDCDLSPGRYTLLTHWLILPKGYPAKSLLNLSNEFTVSYRSD